MTVTMTKHQKHGDGQSAATMPELRIRTPRATRLLAVVHRRMTQPQKAWGENLALGSDPADAKLSLVNRRAQALRSVLSNMPIVIEQDDLIVGNTVQDDAIVRTHMPSFATEAEHDLAKREGASIAAQLAHKTPYYPDLLKKGLSGINAEIDTKVAAILMCPPSADRDEKLALFAAMRTECMGVIELAGRYSALAERLADREAEGTRSRELRSIADVCRRVPEYPARTFREALQAFWMMHYAFFSTETNISCGRIDQILNPYLTADLEAGQITLPEAQELIDCLWLRFNDRAQICRDNFFNPERVDEVPDWAAGHRTRFAFATDAADAINHFGQNILLGGVLPDGTDGTNEVSFLCLNALEKFAFTSPVVTVRFHQGSPGRFVDRSMEVLKTGGGMPYINNDDTIIAAYVELGVPPEDARDYANSNCWETMIQGKSDQELIRGMNFLLCLELALRRGVSSVHGQMGPDTGDPRAFRSFDEVMQAWKSQLDFQLMTGIDYIGDRIANGTLEHSSHGKYRYNPLLSAVTLDCIKNGQDVIRGGARYTIWHVMGEAVANTIDSLAALKKFVFEDRVIDMDGLLAALNSDWQRHEDLRRRILARSPRFANDDDYADRIGTEMVNYFVERTRFHAARHPHVIFPCSIGTFSWYTMIGKEVGPTPDGRRNGDPVAANFSPAVGADLSGPTAAINSYVRMPVGRMAAGAPMDLRLSASSVRGETGTRRMAGLARAFVDMGGNMLTLTVTDVEELKRAMREPEKYRHLRVRMGGWSAYFVMLGEEQQRLHIQRVEHGLA